MNYTIEKITTLLGARRIGTADAQIGWLLTDSRSLCFPEETLFFALKTARNDGHRYISDLYRRGVRNFVVCDLPADMRPDANYLVVPSPLEALQRLAERHRDEFNIPVVGITGSNGKTMVKEWLYQVLSPDHVVTRSPKSYNSQIGVPLSVWLLNDQTEVGIFEAGISQLGEMDALHDIIQPTIGVLTSLGSAHQENFRSLEEKCMEKLKLFHDAKVLIYNADDDLVSRCIRRFGFKGKKIGWRREELLSAYQLPFYDEASITCSLAVAATALYLGVTPQQLAEREQGQCTGLQRRPALRIPLHGERLPRPHAAAGRHLRRRRVDGGQSRLAGALHRRRFRPLHRVHQEILTGSEFPSRPRLPASDEQGLSRHAA